MSIYDILDWIWYGFMAVIIWPIVVGFSRWTYLSRPERGLVWFLVAMLGFEIIGTLLRINATRNHFMHYFQTLAVLCIGAYFYTPLLGWHKWPIRIAWIIALCIPIEVFGWVGFNHINAITETIAWFLIALYAFVCLIKLLDHPLDRSIRHDLPLYIHAGFMILGFFRAGRACFLNYFIETSIDLYYFVDTMVVIVGAVAYGLFAIGFTLKRH